MKKSLLGVFTPQSNSESVKFQKLAIALGFGWGKAGAKVIGLKEGQSIKLGEGMKLSPKSDHEGDDTITISDLQTALIEDRKDKTVVTRTSLLAVYNKTRCREIEEIIRNLLQENFDKDDNEEFVVPQDLLERASRELDDEQRIYFRDAGIPIPQSHPNDKYTVTQSFGTDLPGSLREVEVTELGVSSKMGTILMDGDGNIYFTSVK